MPRHRIQLGRFWHELRRRRVVQVTIAYVIGAWVSVQAAAILLAAFSAPPWALRSIILTFVCGMPVAWILSWFFDLSAEGIVRTPPSPKTPPERRPSVQAVAAGGPFEASASEASRRPERRSITVVRYAIVCRREDRAEIDPEELGEIALEAHRSCKQVIGRFGGYLAWTNQSEAEVYFGYPRAMERDAQSAVRCSLALRDSVSRITGTAGITADISVGICTGVAVAELDSDHSERLKRTPVTGEVLRDAARLLYRAPARSIVVAQSTRELLGQVFDLEKIEPSTGEKAAWFVSGESSLVFRSLSPPPVACLRGRDYEYEFLKHRWNLATGGDAQTVALVGGPGYGKSALVSTLIDELSNRPGNAIVECRCSPLNQNVALYPVTELFTSSLLDFEGTTTDAERLETIERYLTERDFELQRYVPILADFMGVGTADKYRPLTAKADEIRDQTLELLIEILLRRAASQPVLLVVEDLHWSDPNTRELLGRIIRRGPHSRILTLLTYRPEFEAPWSGGAMTQLNLAALTPEQAHTVVDELARGATLSPELRDRIVTLSDGVPLFLEELTKAVLDSSGDASAVKHIPATLQETLTARLDRLGPHKRVAQMAAVFGREFQFEWIQALTGLGSGELSAALDALVVSELAYARGVQPRSKYVFKHALIHEAAYESLLKRERQDLHRRIAALFEDTFQDFGRDHPQIVASHHAAADEYYRAAALYLEAGKRALHRSAYEEAQSQFTEALRLIGKAEVDRDVMRIELELQINLGHAMTATEGFFSKAVERTFIRAMELSSELDETVTRVRIAMGLWRTQISQGRLLEALGQAEALLLMAERAKMESASVAARTAAGITRFHLGALEEAEGYFRHVIADRDLDASRRIADDLGQDPSATCLSWYSVSRWLRGHPRESLQRMNEAIAVGRKLDHAFTLAYVLRQRLSVLYFRGDIPAMQKTTAELEALAHENAFSEMALYVNFWSRVITIQQTKSKDPIEGIVAIVKQSESLGVVLNLPHMMALLAEQRLAVGEPAPGLEEIERALQLSEASSSNWYSAELHRLKGRLIMAARPGALEEAESCFKNALAVSREQDCAFFALRAHLDLGIMHANSGRRERALEAISAIETLGIRGGKVPEMAKARELKHELAA